MMVCASNGSMTGNPTMLIQLVLAREAICMSLAALVGTFPCSAMLVNRSKVTFQVTLSSKRLTTFAAGYGTPKRVDMNVDDMSFKLLACV